MLCTCVMINCIFLVNKVEYIPIMVKLCNSVASRDCNNNETNGEIVCTTIYETGFNCIYSLVM